MNSFHVLLSSLALVFLSLSANAQVEARVHQVFNSKANTIDLQIDEEKYEVNIKETYSTVIIVEVLVTIDLVDPDRMEEIIASGRYHVSYKLEDGVATFKTKKDLPPILVDGVEAEEYVIYNISIPEYVEFEY